MHWDATPGLRVHGMYRWGEATHSDVHGGVCRASAATVMATGSRLDGSGTLLATIICAYQSPVIHTCLPSHPDARTPLVGCHLYLYVCSKFCTGATPGHTVLGRGWTGHIRGSEKRCTARPCMPGAARARSRQPRKGGPLLPIMPATCLGAAGPARLGPLRSCVPRTVSMEISGDQFTLELLVAPC